MRSAYKTVVMMTAVSALHAGLMYGQGTFQNLDFESATVPNVPAGQFGADVLSTDGLPGWITYLGTNRVATILHNNLNLGDPAIVILGPSWSLGGILQGQYSVRLQASFPSLSVQPAIAQTGIVPADARSIRFYSHMYNIGIGVSFGGQIVDLSILGGSASSYFLYGGDISSFAGQTGELRCYGDASLDNIHFSDLPIPEPSALGLFGLGILVLALASWRDRRGSAVGDRPIIEAEAT